ncbi:mycothiol synthase [Nonomuraea thailandensis]|uniref:Mycothiol synthase n=1 Tax=Nonomuraea thailandensis TaxID=1188745 RepID=A0A9X2GQ52_9ACTN|nr:GNAT family N-acetyltransferase [Nonomuraea thailandensis]MCP2363186.1 mycothiol synthase [Nonomuraea thailandensis]
MEWGPLTQEDARSLAGLWAAMADADGTGEPFSVEDVREQLFHRPIDLAGSTLVARDGERVAAFGHLTVRQSAEGGLHVLRLWGGVHPAYRRRGIGRRIVGWAVGAAPLLSERAFPGVPAEIHLAADDHDPGVHALARGAGFAAVRRFALMERGLKDTLPEPRAPDGVTIATWTPELDDGARHVRNESFRDHWGTVPHTRESWAAHITGTRNFRPLSSFLALAGGQVVGALITHAAGEQAHIMIIGTLREWRGRGVASALIAHALAAFARQGYRDAGLNVDLDNPTGAVGVYERAGFMVIRSSTNYALPVR